MVVNLSDDFLNPNGIPVFILSCAAITLLFVALGLREQPKQAILREDVLGLATENWPRECPECEAPRFYQDFWPTPIFTLLDKGETRQPVIGTANSMRLFTPEGEDPTFADGTPWPPPRLQGLDPYYVHQLLADRDGDGNKEILSVYAPIYGQTRLDLRWLDLRSSAPIVERSYSLEGAILALSAADLNGDQKDELVIAFERSVAGQPIANSVIAVYNQSFDLLWKREIEKCALKYYKYFDTLAVGDVDGDRRKEIFFGCEEAVAQGMDWLSTGKIYAFSSTGEPFKQGPREDPYLFYAQEGGGKSNITLGDLNRDGVEEIIVNPSTAQGNLLILNPQGEVLAQKSFSDVAADHNHNSFPPSSITLANLDNSGALEVVISDFFAKDHAPNEEFFGRIYILEPDLDESGSIVGIKSLNPENEKGLVWESTSPLHSHPLRDTTSVDDTLQPTSVLVGDVSGDGVNDLITSWWPSDRIYAFSPQFSEGQLVLNPIDGWPIQLTAPSDVSQEFFTVGRNALTLADVDRDHRLELITVGHYRGPLNQDGFNADWSDDRFFIYLFKTPGRVSNDLEWPVWRNNFGLTAEYHSYSPPPESASPSPPCNDRAPDSPVLSAPPNGTGDISYRVGLSWSLSDWGVNCAQGSNNYTLYLDKNTVPTTKKATLSADETSAIVKGLKYSSTYYWKIKADNGVLSSESPAWKFDTCVPESKLPGDVTCDCAVTLDDLITIARIYGRRRGEEPYDPALDLYPAGFFGAKGDGKIDLSDLIQVANKWNTQCSE